MIYSNIKIFCVLFFTTTILGSWFSPQPDISSHKMWIDKYACEFSIDENLVAAMIMTESGGDVKAVSTKGAQGLMQITPATAKNLCKKLNIHFSADMLWQAERNIFLGCYYIHHLLNTFDGCIVLALAAYNCGPNRVRGWRQKTPHLTTWKILETHASSETKHFVWSVLYRYRNRN